MVPAGLHEPLILAPVTPDASVNAGPPARSTRLRLLSAKKPIERLSGDQNGATAFSVPATGWARVESSGRSQSWFWPPELTALNTSFRPSGESANHPFGENDAFSGGAISALTTGTSAGFWRNQANARTVTMS